MKTTDKTPQVGQEWASRDCAPMVRIMGLGVDGRVSVVPLHAQPGATQEASEYSRAEFLARYFLPATARAPQVAQIWASRNGATLLRIVSVTDETVDADAGAGPQRFSMREFLERCFLPPADPAPTASDFASDEEFAVYQLGVGSLPPGFKVLPGSIEHVILKAGAAMAVSAVNRGLAREDEVVGSPCPDHDVTSSATKPCYVCGWQPGTVAQRSIAALQDEGWRKTLRAAEAEIERLRSDLALMTDSNAAARADRDDLQIEVERLGRVTKAAPETLHLALREADAEIVRLRAEVVAALNADAEELAADGGTCRSILRTALQAPDEDTRTAAELAQDLVEARDAPIEALRILGRPLGSHDTPVAWAQRVKEHEIGVGKRLRAEVERLRVGRDAAVREENRLRALVELRDAEVVKLRAEVVAALNANAADRADSDEYVERIGKAARCLGRAGLDGEEAFTPAEAIAGAMFHLRETAARWREDQEATAKERSERHAALQKLGWAGEPVEAWACTRAAEQSAERLKSHQLAEALVQRLPERERIASLERAFSESTGRAPTMDDLADAIRRGAR